MRVLSCLVVLVCCEMARAVGPPVARLDTDGAPLPAGAKARLGTRHLWQAAIELGAVAFSHDSKLLASGCLSGRLAGDRGICLWEVSSGRLVCGIPTLGKTTALAFSRNGRWLAGLVDGRLQVWDLHANAQLRWWARAWGFGDIRLTFDSGDRMVILQDDSAVLSFDVTTGRRGRALFREAKNLGNLSSFDEPLFRDDRFRAYHPRLSPDGKAIVWVAVEYLQRRRHSVALLPSLASLSERPPLSLLEDRTTGRRQMIRCGGLVLFAPTGELYSVIPGAIQVWSAGRWGQAPRTVPIAGDAIAVPLAATKDFLITLEAEQVCLRRTRDMRLLHVLPFRVTPLGLAPLPAALSADGKLLASCWRAAATRGGCCSSMWRRASCSTHARATRCRSWSCRSPSPVGWCPAARWRGANGT